MGMEDDGPDGPAGARWPAGLSRRSEVRYAVRDVPLEATWLADAHLRRGRGRLLDLSAGGFGARMSEPPPTGRLLHVRIALASADGAAIPPVDAEVRVCGRRRLARDPRLSSLWRVHFAFESVHPADRKRVDQALDRLRTVRLSQP